MYNTILPHFYLYYSNEYVGAGFNENKKIGLILILTVAFKKGPLSKNDFGPAEAAGRSQTRPVEFFGRGPFYYSN
mgnify:CR=1 FL=1